MDRLNLLPYKSKLNVFDKKTLIFSLPFEINTKGINSVFYTAFNSISHKEHLINIKFVLVNSMQQNLQSLFVHGHKLLKTVDYCYKKCSQKNCSLCAYSNNNSFILLKDKFYHE